MNNIHVLVKKLDNALDKTDKGFVRRFIGNLNTELNKRAYISGANVFLNNDANEMNLSTSANDGTFVILDAAAVADNLSVPINLSTASVSDISASAISAVSDISDISDVVSIKPSVPINLSTASAVSDVSDVVSIKPPVSIKPSVPINHSTASVSDNLTISDVADIDNLTISDVAGLTISDVAGVDNLYGGAGIDNLIISDTDYAVSTTDAGDIADLALLKPSAIDDKEEAIADAFIKAKNAISGANAIFSSQYYNPNEGPNDNNGGMKLEF